MVTYVYGIVGGPAGRARAAVAGVRGVGGQPVRSLPAAGLAVAVGEAPAAGTLAATDLWAHERVVEALAPAGPVLPARFGSRLPDDAAVVAFVAGRAGALRSALSHVRGRAELAVRARREPEAAPPAGAAGARAGPGTAYLARRVADAGWAASLRETVHVSLMALAVDGRWRAGGSGPYEATGAYLVETGSVRDFAAAVAELAGRLDRTALTCTGPWPPYSFAAVEPA
jgi:hypothetical protein